MRIPARSKVLVATAAAIPLLLGMAPSHAPEEPQVIASGLNNPRGLSFAPDGALYIAEAGTGGAGPCFQGPEGPACYGHSGSVTRVSHKSQRRVLTGLPSYGGEGTGDGAIGPVPMSSPRPWFTSSSECRDVAL